jgi:hypothetical protein
MALDLSNVGTNKKDVSIVKGGVDLSTVEGVLTFYAKKIIENLKKNLEDSGRISSHVLEQSIRTLSPDFVEIKKQAFGNTYVVSIAMEDYYQWVDEGRKPGKQPPVADIVEWIKYKPLNVNIARLGEIRERGINKRKPYTKDDLIKAKAFQIARKIGLRGTKASRFYSDVVNETLIKDLNRDLGKALKRDVEISFKNFNDSKEFLASGTKRYDNN